MDLSQYKRLYEGKDAAPGWDAIDAQLDHLYPGQKPQHWGTTVKYALGGPDPLDGISAYQTKVGRGPNLHFCTYGYSSLYYDEESVGGEDSGYGFEMTFRLASELPPKTPPNWVCNFLQNLARYVFKSGKVFRPNQWIDANGPIRADTPTKIVGLAFVEDPDLKPIDTPHGRVAFVQAFGVTQHELAVLKEKRGTGEQLLDYHRSHNPQFVTDLNRG